MGPRLFQEFVEAGDLGLGSPAALGCEAVVAAPTTIFGLGCALRFKDFDDQTIFEEALDQAV